jgi:hypothetical protein
MVVDWQSVRNIGLCDQKDYLFEKWTGGMSFRAAAQDEEQDACEFMVQDI